MSQYKYNEKTGLFEKKTRQRHFSAGRNSSFLGWDVQNVTMDTAIYSNINTLKARCRDEARNNDYIRHALRLLINNIIGDKGFRLHAKARNAKGRDRAFNTNLEKIWQNAGKLKNSPTVDGKLSRRDAGALWVRTLCVDGEVIIIKHQNHANKYRYAYQFIDTARLDWQLNEVLSNGNQIRMGVEINPYGKPVKYHFLNESPSDLLWGYNHNSKGRHIIIPADRVLHTFIQEATNQTRGVPLLASPAIRSHMLQKFEEAVVVGARVSASKIGFYTTSEDFTGVAPGDEDENYEVSQTLEPGTFEMLPRGVNMESFDPSSPPSGMESFEKKLLKGIASGLGVDYVNMANDLEGVNYSSIRAGQLEQRSIYKGLQRFYLDHFEEPIFEDWAKIQAINPNIKMNTQKLENLIDNETYRFLGRGWAWVDPLKEIKAYGEAIDRRITSLRRVVAEHSGEELEDLLEEIAEDENLLKEYNVQPILKNQPPPATEQQKSQEIEEVEEEIAEVEEE